MGSTSQGSSTGGGGGGNFPTQPPAPPPPLLNAIEGKSFEKYNVAPLPSDNVNYRHNFKKCNAVDENNHHVKKYSVKEI